MRDATIADADALLSWRNDPLTRQMSLQTDEIPRDAHMRWLERSLAAPDRILLIGEDSGTGVAVGMCRFDLDGRRRAEVSIGVAPAQRGRGMGTALLAAGIAAFQTARPDIDTLTAVIRSTNAASIRLFEAAGFRRVAEDATLLHLER